MGEFRRRQFTYVAIYFIALLGLNILTGYNGQISLGHGAFMAIGAYTAALLTLGRPGLEDADSLDAPGWLPLGDGMRPVFTIPIAALVTGLIGFVFGFPALRLAGVSLALATLGIAVSLPLDREALRKRDRRRRRPEPAPAEDAVRAGHLDPALALLRGLGDGRGPLHRRLAPRAGPRRSRLARDPRRRGRRDRLGRQPRDLQDACVRRVVRLRRRRRSALRDPGLVRQPGHVPAQPLDPAARQRRRRRPLVADRASSSARS